jgi:hypothetical protein
VTIRRTTVRFPPSLLAVAIACAFGNVALAQSSRDYPPTYSSRKAPWYDPFGWLTSEEKKPANTTPKTQPGTPSNAVPTGDFPAGATAPPAWKWYGYGAPTPGANPLAPTGMYPGVSGNWYSSTGATPGAVPHATQGTPVAVDPFHPPTLVTEPAALTKWPTIVAPPSAAPTLPTAAMPPVANAMDVDWKSSAASLRKPTGDLPSTDTPQATLGPPKPVDAVTTPSPAPILPAPRTPAEAARTPGPESSDIPVVPAPGIVIPPNK